MTRLTPEQADAIDRLAQADQAVRAGKRNLRAQMEKAIRESVEAAMRAQMQGLLDERAYWAFRARQLGTPVSQIAEDGLSSKNRANAYDAIAAGAHVTPPASVQTAPAAPAPVVELHPEFRLNGDVVTVTPKESELLTILPLLNLERADLDAAPGLRTADYRVTADGFEAITEGWFEALGFRHPVVAMAGVGQPLYKRLSEFIQSQRSAAAA